MHSFFVMVNTCTTYQHLYHSARLRHEASIPILDMCTSIFCARKSITNANTIQNIVYCDTSLINNTIRKNFILVDNNNDRLTAFDPGQPGYAGTRRNIHPLTPIRIIVLPLSSFSICNGPWHPLYSTYVLDSPHVQPLDN